MEQATQTDYSGRPIKRWFVTFADGKRVVTWASTAGAARIKATQRGYIGMRGMVIDVKPAPPLVKP